VGGLPLRTRLAPSPTGALHLGNARTFLLTWLWARSAGARIVLRVEDIDGPRVKQGATEQALLDLRWLGLDWDEGPFVQTERLPLYEAALAKLGAYPCVCTRKEVEAAASAPHGPEDEGPRYPGTCRGRYASAAHARAKTGRDPAWRFPVPEGAIEFTDIFAGRQSFDVARTTGDFVVYKSNGPAYQLAVVVDDAAMGITHVIRGDDLLASTPRQLLLYRKLGLPEPSFAHLPLVVGEDGRRLAKRHGDTRIATYREAGVPAARLLGLLARWSGLPERATAGELALDFATGDSGAEPRKFAWQKVPHGRVVFTAADDLWLRGGASRGV
jgi:glutamyl-tRNA synthetase